MNKKAIELSINFIVLLIIAIAVFSFGIRFIYLISKGSTDLQDVTFDQIDRQIESLLCESTDRVCIGTQRKTIKRKEYGVFGLRIVNDLGGPKIFNITIEPPSSYLGFDKNSDRILHGEAEPLIIKARPSIKIKNNEEDRIGIAVEVPRNATSGKYILNVKVTNASGYPYGTASVYKIYVDVP